MSNRNLSSFSQVWWAETERCTSKSKAKTENCRSDQDVGVDSFGDASCVCAKSRAPIGGRCFECYQRGPCRKGEVVAAGPDGEGVCVRDRCVDRNRGKRTNEYAPLEGKGKCYRLGGADPCSALDPQSRFVVNPVALVPRCSSDDITLHLIDAPLLCRLDDKGECREEVEVEREDRIAYLARIKRDLARRRKKSQNQ